MASPPTPAFLQLAAHPLRWRLLSELAASDYRVRELVDLVGQPQNLVSYHLRLLRDGGLVSARRSTHDARDSYYHLDLARCADALTATAKALHPALAPPWSGSPSVPLPAPSPGSPSIPLPAPSPAPSPGSPTAPLRAPLSPAARPPRVLFACTGNSARSPIAEALLRHRTGGRVEAVSAGSQPRPRLHPDAVAVLGEHYGIDVGERRPRHLDTVTGHRFDYVISLCDKVREVFPDFPGSPRRLHWSIPDPATAAPDRAGFVRTAEEIDARVHYLLPVLTSSQEVQS